LSSSWSVFDFELSYNLSLLPVGFDLIAVKLNIDRYNLKKPIFAVVLIIAFRRCGWPIPAISEHWNLELA
jgi:hypothetical protein